MASLDACGLSLQMKATQENNRAVPTGKLEVRYTTGYRKLMRTLSGSLLPLVHHRHYPPTPVLVIQVPPQVLLRPAWHRVYLYTAVSSGLNLDLRSRKAVAVAIASFALQQQASWFTGYSMVAELDFYHEEVIDERILALESLWNEIERTGDYDLFWDDGDQDLAPKGAASRSSIDKFIEKGSFVASESDQELGMCSICLEEFSSSVGAELLRMDCSHFYHRACILPWLEKSSTCPTCRRQVD